MRNTSWKKEFRSIVIYFHVNINHIKKEIKFHQKQKLFHEKQARKSIKWKMAANKFEAAHKSAWELLIWFFPLKQFSAAICVNNNEQAPLLSILPFYPLRLWCWNLFNFHFHFLPDGIQFCFTRKWSSLIVTKFL